VGLFIGCTSALLDREAIRAALVLLRQAGFEVVVPVAQQCCGALDAHAGNAARAARLMRANESAFREAGPLDAVVSIATGCGAHLHDYDSLPAPHEDISSFLARKEVLERLRFRPLRANMAVHLPCSLVNVLQQEQSVLRLLERIPELQISEVGRRGACCGAAGTAVLLRPQVAGQLRVPLAEEVEALSPDGVLSGNVSCRLHLAVGDDRAGRAYRHPLVLLAQQLIRE
jgi:glycolate oxidase iron-sulfur subunit